MNMGRDMNEHPLPPELADLENRLLARRGDSAASQSAATEVRAHVLSAVHAELAMEAKAQAHSSASVSCNGWCWAAVAAAVLVALNLALVDGSATEFTGGIAPVVRGDPSREMQQIDKLEKGILQ
jgi:hypothetical protein